MTQKNWCEIHDVPFTVCDCDLRETAPAQKASEKLIQKIAQLFKKEYAQQLREIDLTTCDPKEMENLFLCTFMAGAAVGALETAKFSSDERKQFAKACNDFISQ